MTSALADLKRRIDRAEEVAPISSTDSLTLDQALALLGVVFGEDFVAIPSLGVPPGSGKPARSLASDTLISDAPDAPVQVLQQTTRVRDGVGRWRKLNLIGGAAGRPPAAPARGAVAPRSRGTVAGRSDPPRQRDRQGDAKGTLRDNAGSIPPAYWGKPRGGRNCATDGMAASVWDLTSAGSGGGPRRFFAIMHAPEPLRAPGTAVEAATKRWKLMARLAEILELVVHGLTNQLIADALGIERGTVEFHLSGIFDKSGVCNRATLILQALELRRR